MHLLNQMAARDGMSTNAPVVYCCSIAGEQYGQLARDEQER